jgi:ribosome biogenesis GTPase A
MEQMLDEGETLAKLIEESLNNISSENSDLLDSSTGKDIIIFLGKTGSGKSTLINFLAGKSLRIIDNTDIVLEDTTDPSAMKIGLGGQSETILPKFITLNNTLLYDLPTFSGTSDTTINIINACLIKNIIESAASVRLVFVASEAEIEAERGRSFKELLEIRKHLIPNQNIEEFSSLILTKTSPNKSKREIITRLRGKTDPSLTSIWAENGKIAKMTLGEINLEEKEDILVTIMETKPTSVEQINIDVIINSQEQSKIKNIYKGVIKRASDELIHENVSSDSLPSLKIEALLEKKQYLEEDFAPDVRNKVDLSSVIKFIRPISINIYAALQSRIDKIINPIREKNLAIIDEEIKKRRLEDGDYNICCHTRNKGLRFLEAFPRDDVVRPRYETSEQDQIWSIKLIKDNFYSISCYTRNEGLRFLEAFPNEDFVRPRPQVFDQNQVCDRDQLWSITLVKDGLYSISCNTRNGGLRFLEAFPREDAVRPRPQICDQDQMWSFIKQH